MSNYLAEYLVSLGLKDNLSGKLKNTLNKSSENVKVFAKNIAVAGGALTGLLAAANSAIAKFTIGLVRTDDEITAFAEEIGKSKEEAMKLKFALDAMGKSMEEVGASAALTKTFQQLRADAEAVKPPDLSEGLNQVRELQTEFLRFKQAGMYAVQWVGHYLLKYLHAPLGKLKEAFAALNKAVLKNLPEWSRKLAAVMASIVSVTIALIRGAMAVFNAIQKIFDMIPDKIKALMLLLGALAIFIRAGPIGRLMMIFTILALLVEDFFVYLDGGQSLLGGFWQMLINIWKELNKQGGAVEKLKIGFKKAMDIISNAISMAALWLRNFWKLLKKSDAVDNFREAFIKMGNTIRNVFQAIMGIITALFSNMPKGFDSITPFLVFIISDAIPKAIGLIADIVNIVASFIQKLNELGLTKPIILAVVSAFAAFKAIGFVTAVINGITGSILGLTAIVSGTTLINSLTGLKSAFLRLAGAIKGLGVAIKGIFTIFKRIPPFALWIVAIGALIGILYLLFNHKDKVKEFVDGIKDKIKEFAGIAKAIINKLLEMLPQIFAVGIEILNSIINGLLEALPELVDAAVWLIQSITGAIVQYLPATIETGVNILTALIEGLVSVLPALIEAIVGLITSIIDMVITALPGIIEAGIQILMALLDGIIQVMPVLIQAIVDLITSIFEILIDKLPEILECGVKLLMALVDGILSALPQLAAAVPKIIGAILDGLINLGGKLLELGIELAWSLWNGIVSVISHIGIAGFFEEAISGTVSAVKERFSGLIDWLNEKAEGFRAFIYGIVSTIKEFFINLWLNISETIGAFVEAAVKFFTSMIQSLNQIISTVVEIFRNIFKKVSSAFKAFIREAVNLFKDMVKRVKQVISTITELFSGVWEAVKHDVQSFIEAAISFFEGLVERLKQITSTVIELFAGVWETVKLGILSFIEAATEFFSGMVQRWEQIISAVIEVFTGVWEKVKTGIQKFIREAVSYINELIKKIKEQAGKIAGFFIEAWDKAKNAAKSFVDNVLSIFNPLTSFIDGIGKKIDSIFSGKKTLQVETNVSKQNPSTGHAEGGIFTHEHVARVSEGNMPEAIIPLKKPSRAKEILSGAMNYLGLDRPKDMSQSLASLQQEMYKMHEALTSMNTTITKSNDISYASNVTNVYNENIFDMKSSYTINDVSGRPAATANAVDRTKQLQMRNLKGILNT